MHISSEFFQNTDAIFLWYFTAINLVYLVLLIIGSIKVFRRNKEVYLEGFTHVLQSNFLPEISFIVPALNEGHHIDQNIRNMQSLSYLYKQIIVINDGSKDNTLAVLKKELDLTPIPKFYDDKIPTAKIKQLYISKKFPEFLVIDKENGGGKFDALNAGINAVQNPYYVAIDADTLIDDKSFLSLVRPLLTDPNLIAVGASVKISNGCSFGYQKISTSAFPRNILPALQTLEYMRSFLERQGWDYIGGNFVLAGAFSIFKTEAIVKVGGYVNTVAEDMEIIIRLHRVMTEKKIPYRIMYLPDPVAWTKAPEKIKTLSRQRAKWHRGLLDCLWYHRKMFFNPRYGVFGYFIYPFWLWGEAVEPIIEALGMIYIIVGFFFGKVFFHFFVFFLITTWGFTLLFTTICILIEEFSFNRYPNLRSLIYLFLYNLLENFGYRQMYVVWRLKGCWNFLKNFRRVRIIARAVNKSCRVPKRGNT